MTPPFSLNAFLIAALFFGFSAVSARACDDPVHAQHGSAATDLYAPAMKTMHTDMMVSPTGDADVDFVRGMIPHHQGAVDMAKIVLEHGKDPDIRKMAQDVIAAQEREIKFMQDWLKQHGH